MFAIKIIQLTAIAKTIEAFLLPLSEELHNKGHEVLLVTNDAEGTLKNNPTVKKTGMKVIHVNLTRKLDPKAFIRNYRELRELFRKEKPYILHTHTPVASLISRAAAKKEKVPCVIYTAHGFYFHERMSHLKYTAFFCLEKYWAKRYTDYLICVNSEDFCLAKKNKFLPEEKIIMIPGVGIDTMKKFNPERYGTEMKAQIRKELKITEENKIITFIGRLIEEKGILELIEAFSLLYNENKELRLLIIGDTLKSDRDAGIKIKIQRLLSERNIKRSVIFTGMRDDIPQLLSVTDIFVLPSWREGMPVSSLEAMSMGVPVIGSNIRGLKEEISDGNNGYLFEVGDISGIVRGINKALEERERLSKNARKTAVEKFDSRYALEIQRKLYEECTDTHY